MRIIIIITIVMISNTALSIATITATIMESVPVLLTTENNNNIIIIISNSNFCTCIVRANVALRKNIESYFLKGIYWTDCLQY